MKLNEVREGESGRVSAVSGSDDFLRRISAVGITPGSGFSIVQNVKRYPMLLNVRNTLLAVDRSDCEDIEVEVTSDV